MSVYQKSSSNFVANDNRTALYSNPDAFVGAIGSDEKERIIYYPVEDCYKYAKILLSDASIKLYKEILSNATDNVITTIQEFNYNKSGKLKNISQWKTPSYGEIAIDMNRTTIKIRSEGKPIRIIPVEKECEKRKELVVSVAMIFGECFAGTNTDKSILGLGCGKNGIGAKAANILSKNFKVEAGNNIDGQYFHGVWTDNMKNSDITILPGFEYKKSKSTWVSKSGDKYTGPNFVEVSYTADFEYMGWDKYDYSIACYFAQLASIASFANNVPVTFNWKDENGEEYIRKRGEKEENVGETDFSKKFNFETTEDFIKMYNQDEIVNKFEAFIWRPYNDTGSLSLIDNMTSKSAKNKIKNIVKHPKCMADWPLLEVYLYDTPGKGRVVSFVNGNETGNGGKHVAMVNNKLLDYIRNQVIKSKDVKMNHIVENITIIISAHVHQPKYNAQTKDKLESFHELKLCKKTGEWLLSEKALSKYILNENDIDFSFVKNWSAIDVIIHELEGKLVKPKVKSGNAHIQVNKLIDANMAGRKDYSHECKLFIVEGDSAKSYPIKYRSMISNGNDYFGIIPVRGKIKNVAKSSENDIENISETITNIIKAVGLQENVDYTREENLKTLRYGWITILVDADVDGSHIKGLIILFFQEKFPTFIRAGRLNYYDTPRIKIVDKKGKIKHRFYNDEDYEKYIEEHTLKAGEKIKYFKGLGSSENSDIVDDFTYSKFVTITHGNIMETFSENLENTERSLDIIFGKGNSDSRKRWLKYYSVVKEHIELYNLDKDEIPKSYPITRRSKSDIKASNPPKIELTIGRSISNFVNTDIHEYSLFSLERSIPSILDGNKKSHRQICWVMHNYFKKFSESKIEKVSTIGPKISVDTHYKHGETSLTKALTRLAQDIVFLNNVPLYLSSGQYGSRMQNGTDAASPRYIFTGVPSWFYKLIDSDMLRNVPQLKEEDGLVESEFIPQMIMWSLVNGMKGISTGYSSNIPPHNVYDIINFYKSVLNKKCESIPLPYYRSYTGKVTIHNFNHNIENVSDGDGNFDADAYNVINDVSEEDYDDCDEDSMSNESNTLCDKILRDRQMTKFMDRSLSKSKSYIQGVGKYNIVKERLNKSGSMVYDINISELALYDYPANYIELLSKWLKDKVIEDYKNDCTMMDVNKNTKKSYIPNGWDQKINFYINGWDPKAYNEKYVSNADNYITKPNHKALNLIKTAKYSNLVFLDKNKTPIMFNNIGEVIVNHIFVMHKEFKKLKAKMLSDLNEEMSFAKAKKILIKLFLDGEIKAKDPTEKWISKFKEKKIVEKYHEKLLNVKISILTEKEIDKLIELMDKIKKEIIELKNKSETDMYYERLVVLEKEMERIGVPKNDNCCKIVD